MNHGYVRVPELKEQTAKRTMIIRKLDEFAIEVTIQILDAETNELICMCRADAKADTEAKAIRCATEKCLNEIFATQR